MSQLQLNEPSVHYKEFYGRNIDQMPNLVAEGRTPLSVSGLMQRRLQTLKSSEAVKNSWWNNYFDTGDAIAYHPNGRIKVVLDAQLLREINPQSQLSNGALFLPDGLYEKLDGQEFAREDVQRYADSWLSSEDAKSNPIWQALARDPKLLNDYVGAVFAQAREQFRYDKNMSVYISDAQKDPTMRLWYVRWLEDWSDAIGRFGLLNVDGRLVGVAPEVHGEKSAKPNSTLEIAVASVR